MPLSLVWSRTLPYDGDTVRANVKNVAGVYRLSYRGREDSLWVFYVGKANDLQARLLEHLSANEENGCIRERLQGECKFRVAYVLSEADRDGVERFLYDRFGELCNKNQPKADPIEVNLS